LHIEKLKAQLAALRRARFGRSSEQLDRDIGQLQLLLGDLEEGTPKRRRGPPRSALKSPLATTKPRAPSAAANRCPSICHDKAWSMSRPVLVPPAAARRCERPARGAGIRALALHGDRALSPNIAIICRSHVRPKLSCRVCEAITQAPMPSLPIERGRPGPGLIAHVLPAKRAIYEPMSASASPSTARRWLS
jgi:transposase